MLHCWALGDRTQVQLKNELSREMIFLFFWQSIHGTVHTQLHILPLILWNESSCLVSATTADIPHSFRQSMGIRKSTGTQLPRLSALSANDCLIVGSRDLRFLLLLHRILSDRIFLTVAQEQFTWWICMLMQQLMFLYPIIIHGLLGPFITASHHSLLQMHVIIWMDYENHKGVECNCQIGYQKTWM